MTQDDFESLVRRLEQEAAANPASYRRKLGALAFLGYAYIAATVLLLIGGAAGIVWLATVAPQEKTGLFWRDREIIPW